MARLISKSCFLALVVIFLFVTFAAFFDSLPESRALNLETSQTAPKDGALKGSVTQAPPHMHYTECYTPTRATSTSTLEEGGNEEDEERRKLVEEREKLAEEREKLAEERKKPTEAAKIAKLLNFPVPPDITYDPAGPRPDQIILLCASDGKGHNGGIENLLETTRQNRQAYADLHGYTYHFLNISRYDIGGAHPVWAKLPAIAETFETFPEAQWVWWLDLDAILMTPTVDLNELLLSHHSLERQILKGEIINHGGKESEILTSNEVDVKNIDIIFSQDHNGINAGSFFIRRSQWSRGFLDIWADPFLVTKTWQGQEQDAVMHLVMRHPTVMEHFGLVGQRVLNSYAVGGPKMGWVKGDLVVHFAGCWVQDECSQRWNQYIKMKEPMPEISEQAGAEPKPADPRRD